MAVTGYFYGTAFAKLANKEIDFDSDAIKMMLCTSSYTPDRSTHDYKNDITNEVVGTGYTAGGVTLTGCTIAWVPANSWATARANSTVYVLSQVVRPATGNGLLFMAITAGTSAASAPTWPTAIGATVTDGGVTWLAVAIGGTSLNSSPAVWSPLTLTAARYAVIYDSTPATDATRPLIAYLDFGADVGPVTSPGGLTITPDPTGIAYALAP